MTNKEFFNNSSLSKMYYALNALLDLSEEGQLNGGSFAEYGRIKMKTARQAGHSLAMMKTIVDRNITNAAIITHNKQLISILKSPFDISKSSLHLASVNSLDSLRGLSINHVFIWKA
jgi:hypothetical protein